MKYFFAGLILFICGLAYVRSEQPKVWNDSLAALKAPEDSTPASPISTPPVAAAPVTTAPTNSEASTPTNAPSTNAPAINVVVNSPKVFIPPDPIPAQPNWTWTVLGRDYHNVVVTKVEANSVHIIYDGGIGSLNQADLPPELQKMFNYDPELAAQAAIERREEESASDILLKQEEQQAAINKQKEQAQANAGSAPAAPTKQDLSPQQKAAIQDQITSLQADISFMQGEEAKLYQGGNQQIVKADGNATSHGAYADKIVAEQAQVAQLQQQLR